jgi:hypothetical protein
MPSQNFPIQRRPWQVWLCVCIAALILYNPFAAVCHSHGASEVHSLQRNRATIGASELQHFSPVQSDSLQEDLNLEENREEVAVPAGSYVGRGFEREEAIPQPDVASKVWSRPPPSL